MIHHFYVVYEAEADFITATELADRLVLDSIEWLEAAYLPDYRQWHSSNQDDYRLTWKDLKKLARDAGIEPRGFFAGEPGLADAFAGRRAIAYLKKQFDSVSAILLIRDQDDQPDRRAGLEQARAEHKSPPEIVIGFAQVEREAWVIAGFEPQNETEQKALDQQRSNLGFYPHSESHLLSACKSDNAKRSPKRVLRELTADNWERQRQCWTETSLQTLRERSKQNGLDAFLEEVKTRLAPLIGHVSI